MIGRQLVIASNLYTQHDILAKMLVDLTKDYFGVIRAVLTTGRPLPIYRNNRCSQTSAACVKGAELGSNASV